MTQKYTSADTSLNQVPAVYKHFHFPIGAKVLDYGGGKYDTATNYMRERGVTVGVYDKYNRTPAHNRAVLKEMTSPDYVVCSNVLNVIAEDEIVDDILNDLASYNSTVLISVYEGNGSGVGKGTTKGYQRNAKAKEYLPMISKHFNKVAKRHGAFICNNKEVYV